MITIILFSMNLNFNNRIKSLISKSYIHFFKIILLIDQIIYKEQKMESADNKLTFLVVGHSYNYKNIDIKLENQTHPSVLKFIKKQLKN